MNRIRRYDNKFQVLITPHHRFDAGFELMLGNWTDPLLKGYKIINFDTMEKALEKAFQLPDINWDQMVLWHKDIYSKLYRCIKYELNVNNIPANLQPKILNSHQLKNIMFERVMALGDRFKLGYNMNDIISYHIISVYTITLKEINDILKLNQELRIIYSNYENGIMKLIGQTDLGSHYEILLYTPLIANLMRWIEQNPNVPKQKQIIELNKVLKRQDSIDKEMMYNIK